MKLGAIELGGTKIVCAVGDENGKIFERCRIPTTAEPEKDMEKVAAFFRETGIEAIGIASFGPLELNPKKEKYGHLLATTKEGWGGFDLLESLSEFGVPMKLDTDVNGSCIGESTFGAAKGLDNVLYLTIGTGVGTGIRSNGRMLHGMMHPEGGHVLMNIKENDPGKSVCPFHKNCIEGLASGPSIKARWGLPAEELLDRDEVWELEADYIAQALCDYILVLSPEKIILGGGVMHVTKLFPLIRKKTLEYLNAYLVTDEIEDIDNYIVPAGLGDDQGIVGCLCMAKEAAEEKTDAINQ